MKVPLLDLKAQYQSIKDEIASEMEKIVESQYFILGPAVLRLEEEIAAYCKTDFALGVSSGTDALLIALMGAGIRPGDLILTTPYSFFATAGCITRVGARPVFVDIDPGTYNLSSQSLREVVDRLDSKAKKNLKAIIPVHLYGQCADMDPILATAQENHLVVVEDAAQAIGSEYKGRRAGSMGDYGCFSFFPSKNLGAFGDGGIVTMKSQKRDQKLRILRNHGAKPKYYHGSIGGNFRLDALQAAVVSVKLKYLDGWTKARQENAARYRLLFKEAGLTECIQLPEERENRHIYNQFVISVEESRDELRAFLGDAGVGTEVYYPVPLHLQECYKDLEYTRGDLPAAEHAALHTLAIPIFPELSDDQLVYVVEKIKDFYART
jgi:dTDP-4-amino-4,6-dideoxygalactose transaminase